MDFSWWKVKKCLQQRPYRIQFYKMVTYINLAGDAVTN